MAAAYNYLPQSSSSSFKQPIRSQQPDRRGLRRRCVLLVKHQKTRFYILGRCISMLLCWRDHSIRD